MKEIMVSAKLMIMFPLLLVHVSYVNAQSCNVSIDETTPSHYFMKNNDGTVTHHSTGLMWKVCSEGQVWNEGGCDSSATAHNWQEALHIPQMLNSGGGYAGYSDWRLPNVKELMSIVEFKCVNPVMNETIFNNATSSRHWTSSPYVFNDDTSWGIDFEYGGLFVGGRDNSHAIRLVRSVE